MTYRQAHDMATQWSTDLPTQHGAYWFQHESTSRMILLEARLRDGALMMGWPNHDQTVAKLKAHWRGPIPPSTGPGGR
jgi:hypothetical protein